jgi:preprotein translocase subunit SecY
MGQKKITKMTRWLALPLAFVQSYGMIILLNTLAHGSIIDTSDIAIVLMAMVIVTTGTLFLMWLGEVMTEVGIGNGISVIIMA